MFVMLQLFSKSALAEQELLKTESWVADKHLR